ncbi:MAG: sigma-54 dependent transcriptional regulator [Bdellovibrionota bacterium]|nr:MAG: sigma-54 dependent transcriptional regulator [Bdellovibrionota bacterium]
MAETRILVVEDDESLRGVLDSFLTHHGYLVDACVDVDSALRALQRGNYDCVLADFKLKGKTGLDLLRSVRELNPAIPYLVMTAYGSINLAVETMKCGANDFITKPFEPEQLIQVVEKLITHRRVTERATGTSSRRDRTFLSQSSLVETLLKDARKVARVDSSVLIRGESGTGKELLARFIHAHSSRADKPFVAINCAAIPAELLESELFGHEAGAFTGAIQTRVGIFEYASEGTIFLDEVGDMPAALQVKLLRTLQENEIRRMGSNRIIRINPRVICATNRDLEELVDRKVLRDDFFYRIAVVSLTIPPLRERPEDIDMLIDYFVEQCGLEAGKRGLIVDPMARELLHGYSWPGNIRELENVIERAVVMAEHQISPDHLGIDIRIDFSALDDAKRSLLDISHLAAREAEIEAIEQTLRRTRGNKARAAELLGISYKTLINKVKEYQLGNQGPHLHQSV